MHVMNHLVASTYAAHVSLNMLTNTRVLGVSVRYNRDENGTNFSRKVCSRMLRKLEMRLKRGHVGAFW